MVEEKRLIPYHPRVPAPRRRPPSELARSTITVEYLTEEEYLALYNAAKAKRQEHALLIRLLWETGLRIKEALSLNRADIYPDGVNILHGKGNKQRFVPCQQSLLGDLIRYQETHGQPRIFQAITTKEGANYMLKRYAKLAGIIKRVHPHLFRHSFAINFLKQTQNPFALQDIGGWSDMETIKIYMRLAKEQPREAINKMYFPPG